MDYTLFLVQYSLPFFNFMQILLSSCKFGSVRKLITSILFIREIPLVDFNVVNTVV